MRRPSGSLVALLALAACSNAAPASLPPAAGPDAARVEQAPVSLSYPEGPLIVGDALRIAEMGADRVSALPLARPWKEPAGSDAWRIPGCGPTAVAAYGEGFVALCHLAGDLAVLNPQGQLLRRIANSGGVALRNPNDGASDLRGGAYFSDPGDFYRPAQPVGRVVWLDPQGLLHVVASGLNYPNGVFVTEEQGRRFAYVSEHFSRRVLRFPITADGALGAATVWAEIPEQPPLARFAYDQAGPDGLERAPDGSWYVAVYGEGRVLRLSAEGRVMGQLDVPFQYVTNVATTPEGLFVVGPYIHDEPPFRGGALYAPYAAFAPLP